MRLGIFGGSFDPIHFGHLLLAESCREQCQLDQIWFVPAATSPHKQHQRPVSASARLEMVKLAVSGHPDMLVSDLETKRGGLSYTVDTLESIQRENSASTLFLLMGADSLSDLATWREPQRICELAHLVIVSRVGSAEPCVDPIAHFAPQDRFHHVSMPRIEISSSDLRTRVAAGKSVRYQTPRAVEKYIETNGLYVIADGRGGAR